MKTIKTFFKVLVLFNKLGADTFMRIYLMGLKEEVHHLDENCNCKNCLMIRELANGKSQ